MIVPVLNEAGTITLLLADLLQRQDVDEIIVVDAHSADGTADAARRVLAGNARATLVQAPRGRAAQMNAGAACARSDVLWFVHADTRLPSGAAAALREQLRGGAVWGRFDVRLAGRRWAYRIIERAMNLRSRLSGIATGDQCVFVRRATFDALGGFRNIALMEDVELSRRLKRLGTPARVAVPVTASARRWEQGGVIRTVLLMWWLRVRYFLGADPRHLAQRYGNARAQP